MTEAQTFNRLVLIGTINLRTTIAINDPHEILVDYDCLTLKNLDKQRPLERFGFTILEAVQENIETHCGSFLN